MVRSLRVVHTCVGMCDTPPERIRTAHALAAVRAPRRKGREEAAIELPISGTKCQMFRRRPREVPPGKFPGQRKLCSFGRSSASLPGGC